MTAPPVNDVTTTREGEGPRPSAARSVVDVGIVNDHPVIVLGLQKMLRAHTDRVRFAPPDLPGTPHAPVDITLYDSFAGASDGSDLTDALLADPAHGQVVVYSWSMPDLLVDKAIARGCAGYVDKSASAQDLVDAIERVAAGERRVLQTGAALTQPQLDGWAGREQGLSPRESEVLSMITQGLTNQDICDRAYLSINTVKSYIRSAYHKIDVTRRSQAVKWGMENDMLPPAPARRR